MDQELRERMRKLLRTGMTRRAIAEHLRVSPSTVTRTARLLGFPDKSPRRSPVDWEAVRLYYDARHTIEECRAKFGFSYAAWDKAAARGDITTRPRSAGQLSRATRDEIEHLLAEGLSQVQIARHLALSKSTIAYHARGLGIRADSRFARRHDWAAVQKAIDEGELSMAQCVTRFGFARDSWYRAVKRGDIVPRPAKVPIEKLFVARSRRGRSHLKYRLISDGLKVNRCEHCGITEWHGNPLTMALHHVNGDGSDNRLENLELLCPNCTRRRRISQAATLVGTALPRGRSPGKRPAS
jgi:DNA-binding CsgD family transcriptional regulator